MSTYLDQGIPLLDALSSYMTSVAFLLISRGIALYGWSALGIEVKANVSRSVVGTFAQSLGRFGSMKDVYYLCTAIRELRSDKEVWVSG